MTVRIVKWAEDAEKFLESAKEDSLELDVVISYSCASQTGFGFEDLVNSINSPEIRKKVKKVEIVDSSYLYRHCIPEFSWYADTSVPTLWYLKNKDYIDRLEVDTTVSSWAAKINNDEFKRWHKRVRTDFFGEADGSGLNRTFRELVIRDAAVAAYKGKWNFENCVDFILEECAYICTYFKKSISVYPMRFYDSMSNIAKRYGLDITHLAYKTSSYSRKREVHDSKIKEGIIDLLAEKLDANFFVINKYGEYLYRNGALINVVGTIPPDTLKESWKASMLVMQSQKQSVIEEKYNDKVFLSIKAPLEIEGNVEGVMGVSIDITDRKKAEELQTRNKVQEAKLKLQKKFLETAEQAAHDVITPLVVLSSLKDSCNELSENDYVKLKNSIEKIRSIFGQLLNEYRNKEGYPSNYVLLDYALQATIETLEYSYSSVPFCYSNNMSDPFAFIKGDYGEFCRMITNILNNAAESLEGKEKGQVNIHLEQKDNDIEVCISDNGIGMSKEMATMISEGTAVGTTKPGGHGIGMQQVINTIKSLNGKIYVDSKRGIGTKITLSIPKCDSPNWFPKEIILQEGDTVVAIDDDQSYFSVLEDIFGKFSNKINLKYFANGRDAIDFITDFKEKERLFLLVDYNLRNKEINGMDIIEKTKMWDRSIIITSSYISEIKGFDEWAEHIKLLPKQYGFLNKVKIVINKK